MKALSFLLFLATAGLGAWAFWEQSQRHRMERELTALTAERDQLAKTARIKTSLSAGMEIKEDGPRGLKDLGILPDEEKKTPEGKEKPKTPGEKDSAPGESDVAKMMNTPAIREMLRAQIGPQLELEYSDLFDLMGLDDAKRQAVMNLLKERMSAQTEHGFSLFDKALSYEARKATSEKLAKSAAETNTKIKKLLGADYGKFERFEKSAPERQQIKVLNSMLKDKGLALDEATETKLMDAMFTERQAFKFDNDMTDLSSLRPDSLSEQSVDRFLEQNAALHQQLQAKAKGILSAEQYEGFVKTLEDQQQVAQMKIRMWRQMTGNARAAEAKD